MAEALQSCCQKARDGFIRRIARTITSYPVIKEIPCPVCRRIIPIRLYVAPSSTDAAT